MFNKFPKNRNVYFMSDKKTSNSYVLKFHAFFVHSRQFTRGPETNYNCFFKELLLHQSVQSHKRSINLSSSTRKTTTRERLLVDIILSLLTRPTRQNDSSPFISSSRHSESVEEVVSVVESVVSYPASPADSHVPVSRACAAAACAGA